MEERRHDQCDRDRDLGDSEKTFFGRHMDLGPPRVGAAATRRPFLEHTPVSRFGQAHFSRPSQSMIEAKFDVAPLAATIPKDRDSRSAR